MKRFYSLALLASAALAALATPSFAGTFGLFYHGRCGSCCNSCGVNIQPYNAFTPVCCGVGEIRAGGCGDCGTCGHCRYLGLIKCKHGCCCYNQEGTVIPGAPALIESPAVEPTVVAGVATPPASVEPVSFLPAYSAYPVYPMGYAPAPVWGSYPMPAYYPAPAAPYYGYPMGR